jgi:hypothetical protein
VADDSPAPLPRRVPGNRRHAPGSGQGTRPVGPAALPDDVVQRIRVALDAVRSEASLQEDAPRPEAPDRAEGPTSLPRRVPGRSKDTEPSVAIVRARLPSLAPSWRARTNEASAGVFLPVSASRSGDSTEEITVQPVTADPPGPVTAQPEPVSAVPTDPEPTPAPRPTAEQPDPQGRPGEGTGHQAEVPARAKIRQARGTKPMTRRTNSPARRPKPPARRTKPPVRAQKLAPNRPSPAQQPVPQMALVFPPEPAPEEAKIRPPAPITPDLDRRARNISWAILALLLISVVALIFLL